VDWNDDGKLDILSGCYWTDGEDGGHIQILHGRGTNDFEESKSLENIAGNPLQNVEVPEGVSAEMKAICTQQHAADYDNDGDLDLIVGCFGKELFLYENKADEENGKQSLVEQPVELSIKSTAHHAAPHLVDWDNDGDLDLLSGSTDGGVLISINAGDAETPDWQPFKQLVMPSEAAMQQSASGEIVMSGSTRVWATDWNGDGLQDLLIGDSANLVTPAKGKSAKEIAAGKAEIEKEMQAISSKMEPIYEEFEKAQTAGEEPSEELMAKMNEYSSKMGVIYNRMSDFEESKSTGFVWLMIRKPTSGSQVSAEVSKTDSP
jgi:hypothetical protein